MSVSVSIIGSGVAGLTAAYELCKRGAQITVYERSDGVSQHACTRYAGGMLAPWCERESAEEDVVTLGQHSADWWIGTTGLVKRMGTLVVAQGRDRSELRRFASRTCNFHPMDADQIAELEHDLAGRFQAGLYFAEEAHLDPRKAIDVLEKKLRQKGVIFETGREMVPDELDGLVVDARGYAARDEMSELRGVKGEMLLVRCPELILNRPIRMLHPRIPLYVVPREDHVFMIGATMIESDDNKRITARSMLELLGSAYALHPAFAEAEIIEIGVDVRPAFPDNLPRVQRNGDVISVNGLYRHGFLLSPAMAKRIAGHVFPTSDKDFVGAIHAHQA